MNSMPAHGGEGLGASSGALVKGRPNRRRSVIARNHWTVNGANPVRTEPWLYQTKAGSLRAAHKNWRAGDKADAGMHPPVLQPSLLPVIQRMQAKTGAERRAADFERRALSVPLAQGPRHNVLRHDSSAVHRSVLSPHPGDASNVPTNAATELVLQSGYSLRSLFAAMLAERGMTPFDFAMETNLPHDLVREWMSVDGTERSGRTGATAHTSAAVSTGGRPSRATAEELSRVTAVATDYISSKWLRRKRRSPSPPGHRAPSPPPPPERDDQAEQIRGANVFDRVVHPTTYTSSAAGQQMLREDWTQRCSAEGLDTATFCALFCPPSYSVKDFQRWLRTPSVHDAIAEKVAVSYLCDEQPLKEKFIQSAVKHRVTTEEFCKRYGAPAGDLTSWLDGKTAGKRVVRSVWRYLVDMARAERLEITGPAKMPPIRQRRQLRTERDSMRRDRYVLESVVAQQPPPDEPMDPEATLPMTRATSRLVGLLAERKISSAHRHGMAKALGATTA